MEKVLACQGQSWKIMERREEVIKGGSVVEWDKKGATKSLNAEKCFMCEEVKPIYVVVTMRGKKDLHFPCCSEECQEVAFKAIGEAFEIRKKR